ncbi:DUF58 domain-containing protein [Methanoculleus sp.]|uniref:DUF58 domain-containing protein n=1 Tax=Methanoculleus sp. TaxID=90427 RepID=UPI0025CD652F|nr:DUF58 domain-containing protein [Methanoculleus sp.]
MFRPTWKTGGIAALALALTAVALPLANPAAALAAGSLGLFLLWRGWRFERDLAIVAASLAVEREVEPKLLRQGAMASIRVRADLSAPPGLTVRVRDLPPAVATGDPPLSPPGTVATYTVWLMAPGGTTFGGVIVEASDAYFSRDLICRHYNAPHLQVFPGGSWGVGRGRGVRGEDTRVDRKAALAGQDVRGFRPYRSGDDPRHVDWKVTARRGTLYVREIAGLEGGIPLIAVDLPTTLNGDLTTLARFTMTVYSAAEEVINTHGNCSLLIITSGEVVRFLPGAQDIREVVAILGSLAPVEPHAPLYRASGSAVLMARMRRPAIGAGPEERAYHERLSDIISAFAAENPVPFTVAIREALSRANAVEIRLYSLLVTGDRSHLVQLANEAKSQKMRVVLKAPVGASPLPGIDAMEVL